MFSLPVIEKIGYLFFLPARRDDSILLKSSIRDSNSNIPHTFLLKSQKKYYLKSHSSYSSYLLDGVAFLFFLLKPRGQFTVS